MQQFEYIQIYDHEADLLTRITRDMGKYYSTQGELQQTDNNLEVPRRFDQWSRKCFLQYEKMGQPCQKYIHRIIDEIEHSLRSSSDDDEKVCESCS